MLHGHLPGKARHASYPATASRLRAILGKAGHHILHICPAYRLLLMLPSPLSEGQPGYQDHKQSQGH